MTMTDITFIAALDGTEQKYVQFLPDSFDADVSHDVLIALHGHGSDRWLFATGEEPGYVACRDVAAENNMIFVSPDYRAVASWMGPAAEADIVQIINDLKEQFKVKKVFLTGSSMGGSASLTFAVLHPELIDGVASMNGTANYLEFENFYETIGNAFGGSKLEIPLEYKNRSAEYWPEKLTMPIGFVLSGKDTSVPPDSAMRLACVLKAMGHPNVKIIYRPELGHGTDYEDVRAILEFIIGC